MLHLDHAWGVNVHFNRASTAQAEFDQVGAAFRVARVDFSWQSIETTAGQYDFSNYDALHASFAAAGVSPYFILDYGNKNVPACAGQKGPRTKGCIDAFVAFAIAAMRRFKMATPPALWELWNEPNSLNFWGHGQYGNATEYSVLALALHDARVAAGLVDGVDLVGPAVCAFGGVHNNMTWDFLQTCADTGALRTFDAISVHSYRQSFMSPESVQADYARLRAIAPGMAIVSGEWGWSTCEPGVNATNCPWSATTATETQAARYLARQWLVNRLSGVGVSIYYDYVDDCDDPTSRECRFGTTRAAPSATAPHAPKPAYLAAATLQKHLGALNFSGRVAIAGDDDAYALSFGGGAAFAVWTAAGPPTGTCPALTERRDCGHRGSTRAECEASGCCFELPAPSLGPQCYNRSQVYARQVAFAGGAGGSACWRVFGLLGADEGEACAAANGSVTIAANDSVRVLVRE